MHFIYPSSVTEKAYNNPKFVEDIVRDIADKLNMDDNIIWFSVSAENLESIGGQEMSVVIYSSKLQTILYDSKQKNHMYFHEI